MMEKSGISLQNNEIGKTISGNFQIGLFDTYHAKLFQPWTTELCFDLWMFLKFRSRLEKYMLK